MSRKFIRRDPLCFKTIVALSTRFTPPLGFNAVRNWAAACLYSSVSFKSGSCIPRLLFSCAGTGSLYAFACQEEPAQNLHGSASVSETELKSLLISAAVSLTLSVSIQVLLPGAKGVRIDFPGFCSLNAISSISILPAVLICDRGGSGDEWLRDCGFSGFLGGSAAWG